MTQPGIVGFFRLTIRDAHNMPNTLNIYKWCRGSTEDEVMLQLKTMCSKLGVIEATTITQEEYESNTQIQEQ